MDMILWLAREYLRGFWDLKFEKSRPCSSQNQKKFLLCANVDDIRSLTVTGALRENSVLCSAVILLKGWRRVAPLFWQWTLMHLLDNAPAHAVYTYATIFGDKPNCMHQLSSMITGFVHPEQCFLLNLQLEKKRRR